MTNERKMSAIITEIVIDTSSGAGLYMNLVKLHSSFT